MPDPIPSTDRDAPVRRETMETIPVLAETATLENRVVETGKAVIRKTVSERDEVLDALLARQDVLVTRVPVGRVVAEPPAPRWDGDTWVMPVLQERLVVEKQLVLKEELRITLSTRQEPVQQTVRLREEHVDIDTVGQAGLAPNSKGEAV
ncbi:MAG TPA: YsnF/AvaK domain-containing protein [Acetobacteraceae bacterium]|nr:YsnF/AvaK domain-containing protein [Acetobacteraceae bacterium]